MRVRGLTTLPDSTSQKFILFGQINKRDQKNDQGPVATVFLDFANTRPRACEDDDFEIWHARSSTHQCLMGRKVRYVIKVRFEIIRSDELFVANV